MKAEIKKVSIKKLIGFSLTIVGTISVGSLFTLNQDLRTFVTRNVREVIRSKPETLMVESRPMVETSALEASLDSLLQEAIEEVVVEVGGLITRFDTIDEALDAITDSHEALVAEVDSMLSMRTPKPLLYFMIDGVFTTVDSDTIAGAEDWLRMFDPWFEGNK